MQIELIETFLDLIETRSFHRSAERAGVTQSTVSARLQALEGALGARLFHRSRAGTALTTEGLKFESHARALRHAWEEARRALQPLGSAALVLRIGIQNDLAAGSLGDWVGKFRRALPDCGFYLEPDYSVQMCRDIERGALDFAVLYSPQALPDLHFESLGAVRYCLISSEGSLRARITPARYIRGAYSAAFDASHGQLMGDFSGSPLASGQNAAVAGLLASLGGAGFVLEETAERLVAQGGFERVSDVPAILQPVYAVMHQRHRTAGLHRKLTQIVAREVSGRV